MSDLPVEKPSMPMHPEIINLWYETIYLRYLLIKILEKNPQISRSITEQTIEEARAEAQIALSDRFADYKIHFTSPNEKQPVLVFEERKSSIE